MNQRPEPKAVVVTTSHRGVFFGYLDGDPPFTGAVRIERARMCIYWSPDVQGVVGLAAKGPTNACRVGPAAPAITLGEVTAIIEASPEAATAWEQGPWAK